ncbi:MAG: hypothetical protein ABI127_01215 [Dokdonella sp.]
MKSATHVSLSGWIVVIGASLLGVPHARAAAADCTQVMAALQKLALTPNHQYMIQTAGFDKKPKSSEVIITGTNMYLQVAGKWQSRPYDPQKSAQELAAVSNPPGMTCQAAADETVDGQLASVFRTQQRLEDGDSVDGQIWISKSNGLPLRQTIDMDVGGKFGKSRTEERFEYTHVQAPASK